MNTSHMFHISHIHPGDFHIAYYISSQISDGEEPNMTISEVYLQSIVSNQEKDSEFLYSNELL